MKLTVKNIAKVLTREYAECPNCGGETEICSYVNQKTELRIELFCDGCGTSVNFAEFLVELEKRQEKISKWKSWLNWVKGFCGFVGLLFVIIVMKILGLDAAE